MSGFRYLYVSFDVCVFLIRVNGGIWTWMFKLNLINY